MKILFYFLLLVAFSINILAQGSSNTELKKDSTGVNKVKLNSSND